MKQIMTIVHIDASDTAILTNLSRVAIHRGIQFMYVTETELYDCEDAMVFFTDKFTLLGCIEEIHDYTSMSYIEKDEIWNIVQCRGKEYEGDVSVGFTITQNVKLF